MIAACYTGMRGGRGVPLNAAERDEALSHARIAIQLGSDSAVTLARAGHALVYLNNEYDEGTALVEQALAFNPNLYTVISARAWVHIMCSNAEQAIESFSRMLRISPLEPTRYVALMGMAWGYFLLERYDEGYDWATRAGALRKDPSAFVLGTLIANAAMAGQVGRAQEAAAQLKQIAPEFRVSYALDIFRTRRIDYQERIASALKAAGIPE